MEIPAPQTGSSSTPTTVNTAAAASAVAARNEIAATSLTLSAYVQSSQPVSTSAASGTVSASPSPPTSTPTVPTQTTGTPPVLPPAADPQTLAPTATATTMQAPPTQAVTPPTMPKAAVVTPTVSGSTIPPSPPPTPVAAAGAAYVLDLLMNAQRNTAAAATVPALNEHALKLLAQGQVVRLLAQSPVPVTPGSVLQLQWSPTNGMKILRIHPPSEIPPSVRSFVGTAMSGQGSPAPLLQTLQRVLGSVATPQSDSAVVNALPENVRTVGRQLLALFPDNVTITRPGVLETFVSRASGLFLEASLANALRTALGDTALVTDAENKQVSVSAGSSTVAAEQDEVGVAGKSLLRMLGQLREHLRVGGSDAKVSETGAEPESSTPTSTPRTSNETAASSGRQSPLRSTVEVPNDVKSLLLQLQQQLHAARGTAAQPSVATSAVQGTVTPPVTNNTGVNVGVVSPTTVSPTTVSPTTVSTTTGTPSSVPSTTVPSVVDPTLAVPPTTKSPVANSSVAKSPVAYSPVAKSPEKVPSVPVPVVASDIASDAKATTNTSGAPVKTEASTSFSATPPTAAKVVPGETGKLPLATEEKTTPAEAESTPPSATVTTRYSRLARAADQYQRLEQMTRPPPPRTPTTSVTPGTQENDWLEPTVQWAELATDIDIPGLGLPLPHRQRARNEQAGDSLDNLLGLLLKRTQESLNRLHLHQLSHAGTTTRDTAAQQQNPPLTFDLPVFFDGQIQVFNTRIDEEELPAGENAQNGQKAKQWSVSLGFDIEGLGPMFCQLQMTAHHANLQFWADRPSTLALTRNNIDFLSKSLHELGVSVSEVSCHEGLPKQTRTRLSQQLVDINT